MLPLERKFPFREKLGFSKKKEGNKVYFYQNPTFKPSMVPLIDLKPIGIGNLNSKFSLADYSLLLHEQSRVCKKYNWHHSFEGKKKETEEKKGRSKEVFFDIASKDLRVKALSIPDIPETL